MRRRFAALPLFVAVCLLSPPALAHSGHAHRDAPDQGPSASPQPPVDGPAIRRTSPGKGKDPHAKAEVYQPDEVLGWSLKIHPDLLADEALYEEVRGEIHHQLYRITKVLPEDKVKLLRQVPIWVELKNPYSSNCQYHPSKQWLLANGYLGEKANCVELSDARRFVHSSRRVQPFVLLHELAHAYHDLHLGFEQADIVKCYKDARDAGSYDEVLHIGGRKLRAYAMVDHKEYFAEATEAFFGTNDHYPFTRAELKEHDPAFYEVVKEAWGVK
jgi:hypothetical protein